MFAERAYGSSWGWTMQLLVAIAALGTLHTWMFSSSRLFCTGARNGHLPDALSLTGIKTRTPIPSILFIVKSSTSSASLSSHTNYIYYMQGAMTVMQLIVGNVYVRVSHTGLMEAVFLAATTIALLWLRRKRPEARRPYRVCCLFLQDDC